MSAEWDAAHRAKLWGQWPNENVVRFMSRRFPSIEQRWFQHHVLDVGCGAGGNTRFLAKSGFAVTAIDASAEAMKRTIHLLSGALVREAHQVLHISAVNITKTVLGRAGFDVAIDVACLQCLQFPDAAFALQRIYDVLNPGGALLSIASTPRTSRSVHEGRYNRDLPSESVRALYEVAPWASLKIDMEARTDGSTVVENWIVTATKGKTP